MAHKKLLLTFLSLVNIMLLTSGWGVPQPKHNVWVTLVEAVKEDTLCLRSVACSDVDTIRHSSLQSRAAIDFLLLEHGHGWEDFEGM